MDIKQKVIEFLKSQAECVVSTVSANGFPQAAVVGFAEDTELWIIFGTSLNSRKAQNIIKDSRVSVTFGFNGSITVQYEGIAKLLEGNELEERQKVYFKKRPETIEYKNNPEQVYILIKPSWLRYTDYSNNPAVIEELKEFS